MKTVTFVGTAERVLILWNECWILRNSWVLRRPFVEGQHENLTHPDDLPESNALRRLLHQGDIIHYVSIMKKITQRKADDMVLKQAKDEAEVENRTKLIF